MRDCWGGGVSFVQLYDALNAAVGARGAERKSYLIWARAQAETLAKSGIHQIRKGALSIAKRAQALAGQKKVAIGQISDLRHDARSLGDVGRQSCGSK